MNILESFTSLGDLFYITSPSETTFDAIYDVPNYVDNHIPDLVLLFLLETCISMYMRKSSIRINDTIACLSQGILMEFTRFLIPGGQFAMYLYIYSNWRIVNLSWTSLYTWWFCFLAVDFMYYWLHRTVHEINFLWATHIVHHSSEDYNISTNVRQSILQIFTTANLYLPLAFVVPPTMYLVHVQFSYLYQFWIHTELIKTLGPLEYVLNTPSHHRVHHGANKNCIDKNFGGTLIIWDRMFGTFEAEKEEIVYGLTHPLKTFNLFRIQFDHCIHMWRAFRDYKGWKNKLSVIFKGPGWSPGKPWHGDAKDIPDLKAPIKKYDPELPILYKVYVIWHFFIIIQGYSNIMKYAYGLPNLVLCGSIGYAVFSLVCIGMFLDRSSYSPWIEVLRCLSYFILDFCFSFTRFSLTAIYARWVSEEIIRRTFVASSFFWIVLYPIYWKMIHKPKD